MNKFVPYTLISNTPTLTRLFAMQVLYVNLITAVTLGMMLAAEPVEATVMERPPRRAGKRLLGKIVLWRIAFVCTIMVIIIEAFFYWGELLGEPLCTRRAEAFNVIVFMEIGYSWSCRYIKEPSYQKRSLYENKLAYVAIFLAAGLQMLLTYTPGLNEFFGMCGMGGWAWLRVIVAAIVLYVIVEIEKALVDPLLMPMVRPMLRFLENHSPGWLRNDKRSEQEQQRRAKDHPSGSRTYKDTPRGATEDAAGAPAGPAAAAPAAVGVAPAHVHLAPAGDAAAGDGAAAVPRSHVALVSVGQQGPGGSVGIRNV